MGRIVPYIMENKKCSKPPTSIWNCRNHPFHIKQGKCGVQYKNYKMQPKKKNTHTPKEVRVLICTLEHDKHKTTWVVNCQYSQHPDRPLGLFFCCNVTCPHSIDRGTTIKKLVALARHLILGMSLHYGNFPWELISRIDGELIFQYCYIDEYVPH